MSGQIYKIIESEVNNLVDTKYASRNFDQADKDALEEMIYEFIKTFLKSVPVSTSGNTRINMSLLTPIILFIANYSYPIAFLGAFFYSLKQLVDIEPSQIITNKNLNLVVIFIMSFCGIVGFVLWFNEKRIRESLRDELIKFLDLLPANIKPSVFWEKVKDTYFDK